MVGNGVSLCVQGPDNVEPFKPCPRVWILFRKLLVSLNLTIDNDLIHIFIAYVVENELKGEGQKWK